MSSRYYSVNQNKATFQSTQPKPFEANINTETEHASIDSSRTDLSFESKNTVVAGQWTVLGRIGVGSFGEVFEVEDINTKKKYAIKRETLRMRRPQVRHEKAIYDSLAGGPGIPQCHWYGQHGEFDCIVIDLLGPNLSQLREVTMKLPVNTVLEFGLQMISIMEHVHNQGLVYRDIKPDNFLFSSHCILPELEMIEVSDDYNMPVIKYRYPTCNQVFQKWNTLHPKLFIVDFGLSTWWRDPETNQPYPETKKHKKNKAGTARYASLNVHRNKPHSRRDDIESIGYLLLDLILGGLPWTGIQARNSRAGWDKMKQIKEDTFLSDLCAGLPQGILKYMEYTRTIKFAQGPDYELLRRFLRGSVQGGPFSSKVVSPFGGHTEREWTQRIGVDPALLDELQNTLNRHQEHCSPLQLSNTNNHTSRSQTDNLSRIFNDISLQGRSIESPIQTLVTKERERQKRIGWNSYKHDNEQWMPVTDWTMPNGSTVDKKMAWDKENACVDGKSDAWGDQPIDWASTVHKPWE